MRSSSPSPPTTIFENNHYSLPPPSSSSFSFHRHSHRHSHRDGLKIIMTTATTDLHALNELDGNFEMLLQLSNNSNTRSTTNNNKRTILLSLSSPGDDDFDIDEFDATTAASTADNDIDDDDIDDSDHGIDDNHDNQECQGRDDADNDKYPFANLVELSERAQKLHELETCLDYFVVDYFEDVSSSSSSSSSSSYCEPRRDDSTNSSPSNVETRPIIDGECRSKMLQWALKLLDFTFPPPTMETCETFIRDANNHRHRHSLEALSLTFQAFSYVDRLSSKFHLNSSNAEYGNCTNNNENDMTNNKNKSIKDRSQYKLLCIMCLHLACKTSGLFSFSNDELFYPERKTTSATATATPSSATTTTNNASQRTTTDDSSKLSSSAPIDEYSNQVDESSECIYYYLNDDDMNYCDSSMASSFSSSTSYSSSLSALTDDNKDNNISKNHPTTQKAKPSEQSFPTSYQPTKPRPHLEYLSIEGLVSLSQGEFTTSDLMDMELQILFGLNWRMTTVTPLDWVDLIMMSLVKSHVVLFVYNDEKEGDGWQWIRHDCIKQLEHVVVDEKFMTVMPSHLAMAVLVSSLECISTSDLEEDDGKESFKVNECITCVELVLGLNFDREELSQTIQALKSVVVKS